MSATVLGNNQASKSFDRNVIGPVALAISIIATPLIIITVADVARRSVAHPVAPTSVTAIPPPASPPTRAIATTNGTAVIAPASTTVTASTPLSVGTGSVSSNVISTPSGNVTVGKGIVIGSTSAVVSSPQMWGNVTVSNGVLVQSAEPVKPTPLPPRVIPTPQQTTMATADLARYRAVADTVGVAPSDMLVEEFRQFLATQHLQVYDTAKVVSYMDAVAKRDNQTGLGWHWAPVRANDIVKDMHFGTMSNDGWSGCCVNVINGAMVQSGQMQHQVRAATDFYDANHTAVYTRTIPIHALEKIALIERQFGVGKVAFLVSDYTTQPDAFVRPDPFLMAVVISTNTLHGQGRFIIDAWDEPGFGITNNEETAP